MFNRVMNERWIDTLKAHDIDVIDFKYISLHTVYGLYPSRNNIVVDNDEYNENRIKQLVVNDLLINIYHASKNSLCSLSKDTKMNILTKDNEGNFKLVFRFYDNSITPTSLKRRELCTGDIGLLIGE